jgi:hypothetical protein
MELETVTIHQVIDGVPREAQVPEATVDSWTAQGWLPGPFPTGDDRPPKAGKGSGFQAWVDYAASRDIVLDVGASREDIIAAVEALDVPVEPDVDSQIESGQPDSSETSPVGETTTTPEEV